MSKMYFDATCNQVIYEGVLKKSPPLKSKSLFNMLAKFSCTADKDQTSSSIFQKRWRKRYFVLFKSLDKPDDIHFLYFKNKPSPETRSLGNINMENFGSLAVDVGKKVNKSNVFSIQTVDDKGNNRVYYLSANSLELMHVWVDKIVDCLDLDKKRSVPQIHTPIIHSPGSQSVRGIPRSSQIRYPLTGYNTMTKQTKSPVSVSRSSSNVYPNENPLSYYNMENHFSNKFKDNKLEDPMSTEEEDTYKFSCTADKDQTSSSIFQKFPCEEDQQHPYFNLNCDSTTPQTKNSNNGGQIFFAELDMDLKQMSINTPEEQKSVKNNGNQYYSNNLINLNHPRDQFQDFDFELPKRLKKSDTSSSSSDSSSNTNSSLKLLDMDNDSGPPEVPKRKNISETPKAISLPPKPIKPDNHDVRHYGQTDEPCTTLNYVDATNLLLENKSQNYTNNGLLAFSNSPDSFFPHLSGDSLVLSSDSKKLSPGHEFVSNHHFEIQDVIPSNLSNYFKDVPLIEYSEINDARTEGLHKLNERILKSE